MAIRLKSTRISGWIIQTSMFIDALLSLNSVECTCRSIDTLVYTYRDCDELLSPSLFRYYLFGGAGHIWSTFLGPIACCILSQSTTVLPFIFIRMTGTWWCKRPFFSLRVPAVSRLFLSKPTALMCYQITQHRRLLGFPGSWLSRPTRSQQPDRLYKGLERVNIW